MPSHDQDRPRRVTLFPTCLGTLLFPGAAAAAERVLEAAGATVTSVEEDLCCGQPAWNSGHVDDARRVASRALDTLADADEIVACSGSCTAMVSHYWVELFEGTGRAEEARRVAQKTHEFSSYVAGELGVDNLGPLKTSQARRVAYHDSCHMLRGLGISDEPRQLLAAVEGLELRDLAAQDRCCGFGGTFSIRFPELSAAMADEKVDDVSDHETEELVASDLGCLMQICGRARARSVDFSCRYIAEVLDEAMTQRTP
ncbi:MAG: (Fe-S)-binding protein [Actinomycetota bacterium]|nr:(Fe-S)-binding protein [Actinomycetota bacterium]